MYYEEKIEKGLLYFRTSPDGEWVFMDYQTLLRIYMAGRYEQNRLNERIAELETELQGYKNV